jgi:hypothetical protein
MYCPSAGSIVSVAVDRADVTGRRRDREIDLHLTFFRQKGCIFFPSLNKTEKERNSELFVLFISGGFMFRFRYNSNLNITWVTSLPSCSKDLFYFFQNHNDHEDWILYSIDTCPDHAASASHRVPIFHSLLFSRCFGPCNVRGPVGFAALTDGRLGCSLFSRRRYEMKHLRLRSENPPY